MRVRSESPINREFLANMCGDDAEFEKELVDAFLEASPAVLEQIRSGVTAAEADQVRAGAHTLKGSARAIGADAIGDVAETLEAKAREGDLSDASALMAEVESRYAEIDSYVREHWP